MTDWLRDLVSSELVASISELRFEEKESKVYSALVASELHRLIQVDPSLEKKHLLINLKRDVFNNRVNRIQTFIRNNAVAEPALCGLVVKIVDNADRKQARRSIVEQMALKEGRRNACLLKNYIEGDQFIRACALSSIGYLTRLMDSEGLEPWSQDFFTAVQYLTRSSTKCSPFSYFGTLQWTHPPEAYDGVKLNRTRAHVTLNVSILSRLRKALWLNEGSRGGIEMTLNDTIVEREGEYHFYFQGPSLDRYVSVSVSGAIQKLCSVLKGTSLTFDELRNALIECLPGALTTEAVEQFLIQLSDSGLLVKKWPVSALSWDWPRETYNWLLTLGSKKPTLARVAQLWNEILEMYKGLNQQAASERCGNLESINSKLIQMFEILGSKAEQSSFVKKVVPFSRAIFEDIFLNDVAREDLNEKFGTCALLSSLADLFEDISPERLRMKSLTEKFLKIYKTDEQVNLLSFFEQLEKERDPNTEADDRDLAIPVWFKYQKMLEELIAKKIGSSLGHITAVELDAKDILNVVAKSSEKSRQRKHCFSATIHLSTIMPGTTILNSFSAGYGRRLGRFFSEPDGAKVAFFKDWLNAEQYVENDCEIRDAILFNANIHPGILPFELRAPGTETRGHGQKALSVMDVSIGYDAEEGILKLFLRSTGKTLYMHDLGLLTLTARSRLYQLLAIFPRTPTPNLSILNSALMAYLNRIGYHHAGEPRHYPRIVIGRQLIIKRQQWITTVEACSPLKTKYDSCLIAMECWREWATSQGMPDQVFLRIIPPKSKPGVQEEVRKDEYKPQFVDWDSLACVKLCDRLCRRAKGEIMFTEADPNPRVERAELSEYAIHWRANYRKPCAL